jgi:polysaccharide export outer membrane protein
MRKFVHTVVKAGGIAALSMTVFSCGTVVPGLNSGAGLNASQPAAGDDTGNAAADALFKEITPSLLKTENAERSSRATEDVAALVVPVKPYLIESGDVLSIVVWDHPELNGTVASTAASTPDAPSNATPSAGFVVDHEGKIQFPYAGELSIAGLTEDAARNLLSAKLSRYINKPNVTLRVQSYRSKRIYVDGEVKQPGVYSINDIPMTLMEALNRAGGLLPSADQSRISLSRDSTNYAIDLPQMVRRGVNPGNIMLRSGDVLRVRSRDDSRVFVSGEVVAPRSLTMHNGQLSLNEALGESGGINPLSGDASQVYVIRRTTDRPVVYKLDARAPGALAMAEAFQLDPKDLVYVAATPLTNWHRAISQILPGALSSAVTAVSSGGFVK